uniref:TBC1 domain family member 14 n=1 Tax=Amphiprion percula TaxID=161767 RepID=A0A3P8TGE4_AMPPE
MEYETKSGRAGPGNPTSPRQSVRKNLDFEPLSTTALILEDRPANLPAKPAEEAQKHRQQYEEMVAQAKKRELKEAQKRKKQLEDRCKLEESIGTAAQTWNQEILPNWSTMCTSRRVRDLWWQGIPPVSGAKCGAWPWATISTSHTSCTASVWPGQKRSGRPQQHPPQRLKLKVRGGIETTRSVCMYSHISLCVSKVLPCFSRCRFFRQGVQSGADQAGHLQNLPPTLYLPAGRALPRRAAQHSGSLHVLPARRRLCAGNVVHRGSADPEPGHGRRLHSFCQSAQQALSDGLLQSRPQPYVDLLCGV